MVWRVRQTIQVATTSQYIAEYVQCSTDCVFAIDGSLTFKNPYGYLSAELRHYIIVRAHSTPPRIQAGRCLKQQ